MLRHCHSSYPCFNILSPPSHLCSTKSKGSQSWSSSMGCKGGVPSVAGWRSLTNTATMPSSGVPGMTRWMMSEKGAPDCLRRRGAGNVRNRGY